jgi:RimJ/RimL family protein N-acetyltransferase
MADSPNTRLQVSLPIESPRLRLRRFGSGDLDAFVAYRSLEAIYRYQTWPRPYTRAHGRELIAEMSEGPVLRPGAWFQVAMATRETDALLGDIGTCTSAAAPWVFELGFSIAPAYQRKGLATEALGAWLQVLRRQDGADKVVAVVDRRNVASRALLLKLGFELRRSEVAEYFGEQCVDEHFELSLA